MLLKDFPHIIVGANTIPRICSVIVQLRKTGSTAMFYLASQAGIEPASAAPEATALSIRPLGRASLF